jgi:hypothetical protein
MRLLMGLSKNRHGTYYAIKKVPEHLQDVFRHRIGTPVEIELSS